MLVVVRMPSYLNALHEAMSLIGGGVSWFSVPEYISALVARGVLARFLRRGMVVGTSARAALEAVGVVHNP